MPAADTYGLTRDAKESARLNAQHKVWQANLGFLLHPRIAGKLPSGARIGDMATGTGAWVIDLAREEGSKYCYQGLDMSDDQFPAKRPAGIEFSTLNLLDPVPEDKKETFDFIHVRLLVLGLPTGKWQTACENIMQLLKPGGWLQWEDIELDTIVVIQDQVGVDRQPMQRIYKPVIEDGVKRGFGYDDVRKLGATASEVGFQDVTTDLISSDRVCSTRADFNKTVLGALDGMMQMYQKTDGEQGFWGTDVPLKWLEDATREAEGGGLYYRAELHVITGRKG